MKDVVPRCLAILLVATSVSLASPRASAQSRPGVIGTRAPRWADSGRGRAVQAGVAFGLLALLLAAMRSQVRRGRKPIADERDNLRIHDLYGKATDRPAE